MHFDASSKQPLEVKMVWTIWCIANIGYTDSNTLTQIWISFKVKKWFNVLSDKLLLRLRNGSTNMSTIF